MGEHVDKDLAGITLLLEAAQDVGAAGAEQLDLDAGLLLKHQRDLLRGRDRHRAVPRHAAFLFRRSHVDRIGGEGWPRNDQRGGGAC